MKLVVDMFPDAKLETLDDGVLNQTMHALMVASDEKLDAMFEQLTGVTTFTHPKDTSVVVPTLEYLETVE
ncbi:MAG: hypothetical protein ACTSWQ_09375 [Candidatus Thorarchaeota archaeon]